MAAALRVGPYPGGGNEYFSGVVDDARVYNTPLSTRDVVNLSAVVEAAIRSIRVARRAGRNL